MQTDFPKETHSLNCFYVTRAGLDFYMKWAQMIQGLSSPGDLEIWVYGGLWPQCYHHIYLSGAVPAHAESRRLGVLPFIHNPHTDRSAGKEQVPVPIFPSNLPKVKYQMHLGDTVLWYRWSLRLCHGNWKQDLASGTKWSQSGIGPAGSSSFRISQHVPLFLKCLKLVWLLWCLKEQYLFHP